MRERQGELDFAGSAALGTCGGRGGAGGGGDLDPACSFWIRNPHRGYSPAPWRGSLRLLGALQLACHILWHPSLSLDTGLLGQDHDGSTHGALRTRCNKGSNFTRVFKIHSHCHNPEGSWGQHTPAPLWGRPKQPLQPVMVNSMCQLDQAPGCPRVLSDIGCLWGGFWLSRLGKMRISFLSVGGHYPVPQGPEQNTKAQEERIPSLLLSCCLTLSWDMDFSCPQTGFTPSALLVLSPSVPLVIRSQGFKHSTCSPGPPASSWDSASLIVWFNF